MKKKLGIILAILLCVVLVFTCVACKKDKNDPDPVDTPTSAISGVTTEQINAMEAKIGSYLASWVRIRQRKTPPMRKRRARSPTRARL